MAPIKEPRPLDRDSPERVPPPRIPSSVSAIDAALAYALAGDPRGGHAGWDLRVDVRRGSEPALRGARYRLDQARPGTQVLETALVHVPLFVFKYVYKNQTYTAVVEAATGAVLANIFPAKSEAPFVLVAGVTAAIYLGLASLPLMSGGALDLGLALILAVVAAPFLLGWAAWVANKV